jgi:hypothetical protein
MARLRHRVTGQVNEVDANEFLTVLKERGEDIGLWEVLGGPAGLALENSPAAEVRTDQAEQAEQPKQTGEADQEHEEQHVDRDAPADDHNEQASS